MISQRQVPEKGTFWRPRRLTAVSRRGLGVALTPGIFPRCQATGVSSAQLVASFAQRLVLPRVDRHMCECRIQNNNYSNNTILRVGEEPPPHSGELKHAPLQAGGPTQSQLSRAMSSRHHISIEHRLRRKRLNSDTSASNATHLKEKQEEQK